MIHYRIVLKCAMFGTAHDVLILTVSLILLGAASAETFYVVQNPTEEGVWPSGFETISEAIQVSASGDEIWIASGTYHETISLDHGVHLYGGFTGNESPEDFDLRDWKANPVIIDGTGFNHSVITLSNAADTLFDGIFIRNGRSLYGGGIHCTTSELTLIDCRVSNNEAFTRVDCEVNSGDWNFSGVNTCYGDCYILGGLGGAVYLEESSLELLSSVIESNTGTMGGGVYGVSNSTVLIQDATLSHNAAIAAREVMDGTCCWVHTTYTECFHAEFDRYAGGYGGGVCVSSASLTILDSDVNRNQARLGGGGVDARGTTEVFYFEDSNFEDNLVESNPSLARRG
ncbi:MAG: DUF1565 domain-containing protein, partial [Candidatus Omnitrophica bacterium]|nr:DUF1565 domain-containing protein [Candidatus Omnitrophota bacterium]